MASIPSTSAPDFNIDWTRVEAIVFDLGNVIVDLDNDLYGGAWPANIATELQRTGGAEAFEQWVASENLWYKYDTGGISTEDFLSVLSERLQLSPKQVTDYWNTILWRIRPGIYDLLEKLVQRYPLYILSNTSPLHIEWVRRQVAAEGVADFEARYFRKIFYSYEVGAVKPESAIYAAAEKGIPEAKEGLLFIDDLAKNVEAAEARGWQAVQLEVGVGTEKVFEGLF